MTELHGTIGRPDYMTPPGLLRAVRLFSGGGREDLGQIDLDPCSSELFNIKSVQAIRFRSRDGLAGEWSASSVWLNPPGGRSKPGARAWWAKLLEEYSAGRTQQAFYLSFSLESLQWSQACDQPISNFPTIVFAKRLRFWLDTRQALADETARDKPRAKRLRWLAGAAEAEKDVVEDPNPVSACALTWLPPRGVRRRSEVAFANAISEHYPCVLL